MLKFYLDLVCLIFFGEVGIATWCYPNGYVLKKNHATL